MQPKVFKMEWAGRELIAEFNRFARQANGSCTVRYGDTVILATCVMSETKRDVDFFPLTVDLEERMYAAGKIKGSRFIKREGRPSDEAVLSGRLVDRAIRPLFDDRIRNEIQVVITTLSYDGENDPEVAALIAASLALSVSNIPWHGPIAGVRVGMKDGKYIANATVLECEEGDLDLFIAGDGEKTIMLEAGAKEVSEEKILDAVRFGLREMKPVIQLINKIRDEIGVEKTEIEINTSDELESALKEAEGFVHKKMQEYFFDSPKASKIDRREAASKIKDELKEHFISLGLDESIINKVLGEVKGLIESEIVERILAHGERVDGRALDDTREIICETGILPRTHGSAHFSRGETQVLSTVTLGAPGDVQIIDTMETDEKKRYMHHYNFPPYSVGEVKVMRGPSRRDIGHGALAERAIMPVLPPEKDFPYAIRVVSEVLGSNGSSSMASICGSSLSLMDAGVPIKKSVAGVAIGLASNKDLSKWKILTDIQDLEDGKGGMDFKVAGTADGITAIQMDTKTYGLTDEIVKEALQQAVKARLGVLSKMDAVLAAPRPDLSPYAPRIVTIVINVDKIRDVIGPGGKMINKIIAETGVSIDIEQDGRVMITSADAVGMQKAVDWVNSLTKEVQAGEVYKGKVVRLEDFGAFVNILPGQDGLVHVSEMKWERVGKPSDVVRLGDEVEVKVKEIDNLGRINLSMKELLEKPEGWTSPVRRERERDGGGGQDRGGRGGGGGRPQHRGKGFFRKRG